MTDVEMILLDLKREREEKQARLMPMLRDAVARKDWEKAKSLITLVPELMAAGLEYAYPYLPDEYKFSIPTECYTHNGDRMPIVRKYVRQARKYAPIEKRIPAEMIAQKEIVVYTDDNSDACKNHKQAILSFIWINKLCEFYHEIIFGFIHFILLLFTPFYKNRGRLLLEPTSIYRFSFAIVALFGRKILCLADKFTGQRFHTYK